MNASRLTRLPWLLGVILLVGSLAGAGLLLQNSREMRAGPNDESARQRNSSGQGVFCIGRVDVESGQIPLVPLQPGAVVEVYCHEGQSVRKGDRLLKVNDATFQAKLLEAEAGVKAAEAQLAEANQGLEQYQAGLKAQESAVKLAQEQLNDTRAQLERGERLLNLKIPQVSEEAVVKLRRDTRIAEAAVANQQARLDQLHATKPEFKIEQARRQLEARQAQVAEARAALDRCTLTAPQDGTILRLQAAIGSQYGAQPHHAAIDFAPAGERIVRAEVDQEFASRIALGAEAIIQDEAVVGPVWRGKVYRINEAYLPPRHTTGPEIISAGSNTRVLEVLVSLEPGAPMPKLNQRMRVSIGTR